MRSKSLHIFVFILLAVSSQPTFAQSQASNGQIEGGVTAQDGAAMAGISITAINIGTGTTRNIVTDDQGMFEFPLLPLGNYRVLAEAPGFKKLVLEGVTLATGQTATLSLTLEVGSLRESVTVTSDAPVADPGRIELGRVMNSREVRDLPLITFNPFTFVFLQSNVTGNRTAPPGIGSPNVNANGFSRRGNYQLDGNNATDIKLGGNRMLIISKAYIGEIQLLTSGMSAEFGGTVGHVMNMITPSGTNSVHGDVGYQFRRAGFSTHPFNVPPGSVKRDPVADDFNASIGGPIMKDRWHYYLGFEAFKWDLASAARVITITDPNKQALIAAGVPASTMPTSFGAPERFRFFIGRTDVQVNSSNRLGLRYFVTNGGSDKIGGSRLNTLQTSIDTNIWDSSFAAQLVSNRGDRLFNELRVQRSNRDLSLHPNEFSGTTGTVIRIPGVAVFGSHPGNLNQGQSQLSTLQNNLSYIVGRHSIKVGGGFAYHDAVERSDPSDEYQFLNISAYNLAASGVNRRSYSRFTENFGNPTLTTKAVFWNAFVQDEWKASRRLRINAGLRYDLFIPPDADPSAAYIPSRHFRVDKNNFGPRLGISYAIGDGERPTVIRASAGLYYDAPIINYYISALRNNGSSRFFTVQFFPDSAPMGPDFPDKFGSFPAGQSAPPFSIEALDPDFKTMSALHANLQLERALTEDLAFRVAYSHSSGRHIPTSRAVNCLPVGGTLADGRPIYGGISGTGFVTIDPCTIRLLPQFGDIKVWESVGNLNYNAATFIFSKRFSDGYQFSLNYTLAHSTDDAPEENLGPVNGGSQSDPSNRQFDRAVSIADQTHTLAAAFVGRPRFKLQSRALNYIANHNLLSIIARASSGERYNSVTNLDLNRDGIQNDRPVGIPRNFLKTPNYFNVDVRYSRTVRYNERFGLELFADIVNVTNTNSVIAFGNTIIRANHATNTPVNPFTGELRGPLPNFSAEVVSTDSRRMQMGIRFNF